MQYQYDDHTNCCKYFQNMTKNLHIHIVSSGLHCSLPNEKYSWNPLENSTDPGQTLHAQGYMSSLLVIGDGWTGIYQRDLIGYQRGSYLYTFSSLTLIWELFCEDQLGWHQAWEISALYIIYTCIVRWDKGGLRNYSWPYILASFMGYQRDKFSHFSTC